MTQGTPAEKDSGTVGAALLGVYFVMISILSLGLIISVWPNTERSPSWLGEISAELRYLLLVACGGALGSSLNAFQSLMDMLGNRTFLKSWLLWYALRVLVGIPLAMIFYMVVRGWVLSPQVNSRDLNPYGILSVSVLMGMFATQALDKINAIASVLFNREAALEKQIDRIGAALGVATLDNYQGFACLSFQDGEGKVVPLSGDERPALLAGQPYELIAWFQPYRAEGALANEIRITGGADAKAVEFKVILDSDSVSLRPPQESVSFPAKESSPRVKFQFQAPQNADPYEIWAEVFQKNRLIHVMSATFNVQNLQGA